jgi:hypothetical protein
MISIALLGIVLIITLILVSLINRVQERRRLKRLQQRRLKLQVSNLEEVIAALELVLPNRLILKQINDEILELLNAILALESESTEHLEASLKNVEERGEALASGRDRPITSYVRESDLQIAQTQHYINEAIKILRYRYSRGRLPEEELDIYLSELTWARLMVSVTSYISQGHKATERKDVFSAHAFYQKAQNLLIESIHPDPRRMRMIKELGEILGGNREHLSVDLMPDEHQA